MREGWRGRGREVRRNEGIQRREKGGREGGREGWREIQDCTFSNSATSMYMYMYVYVHVLLL